MFYHCWIRLHFQATQFWANESKDGLITDVLIPFVNGQIIEATYEDEKYLMNLSNATHVRVFKTENTLSKRETAKFYRKRKIGTPCTGELVKEIHLDVATETAKSLIQKIIQPTRKQIFVIMKFGDAELDSCYQRVLTKIADKFNYGILRIDDIENSEIITDQILDNIARSEIIYADLTGERPNCYFETGIAMALGKELILSIKEGNKPHFDVQNYRFIRWKSEADLEEKLLTRLMAITVKHEAGIIN